MGGASCNSGFHGKAMIGARESDCDIWRVRSWTGRAEAVSLLEAATTGEERQAILDEFSEVLLFGNEISAN